MFDKRIIDMMKEEKYSDILPNVENRYKAYEDRYIYILKPLLDKPERSIGHHITYLIHNYLYRSKVITEGWISAVNDESIICFSILQRSHMEVTGAIGFLLMKLRSFYNKTITLEQLNENIGKLWLGDRYHKEHERVHKPYNVMKLIDAVDDLYRKDTGNKDNQFRDRYDLLSEYSHPNFLGITSGVSINSNYIVRFDNKCKLKKESLDLLYHMFISLDLFINFFDEIKDLLNENEEIPILKK